MAHIAGLVAADLHQSPIPYADVVTSTVHKTLRGTRGGLILTNNEKLIKKINKAVFPNLQGGPLEHIIAAKAVTFGEAFKFDFKLYQEKVVENARALAIQLVHNGISLLTGGTDNHLVLIDLRDKNLSGKELEERLAEIGIITNKNAIPFDDKDKTITSGLRLGTPAITSRGLNQQDVIKIADIITECINTDDFDSCKEGLINMVQEICKKYPLYKD